MALRKHQGRRAEGVGARPLRVTHLPYNTASLISHNVGALRSLGVEAEGLALDLSVVHSRANLIPIENPPLPKFSPRWVRTRARRLVAFMRALLRSDILHWYSGINTLPYDLDLKLVRLLGVPALSAWQGSEIRVPEIEFRDNPYYRNVVQRGLGYEHHESWSQSQSVQRRYARAGFIPVVSPGMVQHVNPEVSPVVYQVFHPVPLDEMRPHYPETAPGRPLLVHAPTAPVCKGSMHIERALARLSGMVDFEYKQLCGFPREEALAAMASCDIFLDQFILGDLGMASLEAMALGKPVVCFIKDAVRDRLPPDLPIVIANPDNLSSRLLPLLKSASLRREIGQRSRAYVEKYHDPIKTALRLKQIYEEVVAMRRGSCQAQRVRC